MDPPTISIKSEIEFLKGVRDMASTTIKKHCADLVQDIVEYNPDPVGDLLKMKQHITSLAESQKTIDGVIGAMTEVDSITEKVNLTEEETARKFEESLNKYLSEKGIDEENQEFVDALNSIINGDEPEMEDEDGELFVSKSSVSLKDPITQCIMTDPVKSKICNHAFERGSIMQYLEESPKICPYSGCQSMLEKGDLIDHCGLKVKLIAIKYNKENP